MSEHCSYGCGEPADRLRPPVVWLDNYGREIRFCCYLHERYWREEKPDVHLAPRDRATRDELLAIIHRLIEEG